MSLYVCTNWFVVPRNRSIQLPILIGGVMDGFKIYSLDYYCVWFFHTFQNLSILPRNVNLVQTFTELYRPSPLTELKIMATLHPDPTPVYMTGPVLSAPNLKDGHGSLTRKISNESTARFPFHFTTLNIVTVVICIFITSVREIMFEYPIFILSN